MNKAVNTLRLFLCTFSGEDDFIIRRCSTRVQLSFALIGLFVIFAFIGCFVSATAFTTELIGHFNSLSLVLGIVWAFVVTVIYLLLLYTVSPAILPVAKTKKVRGRKIHIEQTPQENHHASSFTFSLAFRILFISILAIITAQPLNVFLLSTMSKSSIENHKKEYRFKLMVDANKRYINEELTKQNEFLSSINLKKYPSDSSEITKMSMLLNDKVSFDRGFINKSVNLLAVIEKARITPFYRKNIDSIRLVSAILLDEEIKSDDYYLKQFKQMDFVGSKFQSHYNRYKAALILIIKEKIFNYNVLDNLLNNDNFYIKRLQIIFAENPISWILTLLGCLVFILPIYLKFVIRNKSKFYEVKESIEKSLIIDNYKDFKKLYTDIFKIKFEAINDKTKLVLYPLLDKLKEINSDKYELIIRNVELELGHNKMDKYEYWADMPFRTQRKKVDNKLLSENQLLNKLYSVNT